MAVGPVRRSMELLSQLTSGGTGQRPDRFPPLLEQARQAAVLEDAAAGLTAGAVVDRVLLVLDAGDRGLADEAGLAELVVDAVDGRVLLAALAQLEATRELAADRLGEAVDLLRVQVAREREGGEPRRVQDLVCPRAPDAGEGPLVAEHRVEPPRLGAAD